MTEQATAAFPRSRRSKSRSEDFSSSEVFTRERIIARTPNSNWVQALSGKFTEMNNFQEGWDGYDGLPIDFHCARFTEQILDQLSRRDVPAPSLVPMSNGRLQFEWHLNQLDIEVEVHGPLDLTCYMRDLSTGEEQEMELSSDLMPLNKWLDDLASKNQ